MTVHIAEIYISRFKNKPRKGGENFGKQYTPIVCQFYIHKTSLPLAICASER